MEYEWFTSKFDRVRMTVRRCVNRCRDSVVLRAPVLITNNHDNENNNKKKKKTNNANNDNDYNSNNDNW